MRHFIYFTYVEANVIFLHIYNLSFISNKLTYILRTVRRRRGRGAVFPIT